MKDLIGKIAISLHRRTRAFKGKQVISRLTQRLTGSTKQISRDGIFLETRITSTMDLSYLEEGGHSAIRNEISNLKAGQVFLDIGANIGYFSLLASRAVGSQGLVLAIEPSQREVEIMIKNIRHNDASNISVVSLAASQQKSLTELSIEPEHTGLNKISSESTSRHGQPVLTTSIDHIVPEQLLPIHLAKIDTEGFELFTLRGMKQLLESHSILRLIVEISPDFLKEHNQKHEEIYSFLASLGYQPSQLTIKSGKQWDEIFSLSAEPD
ncbi:MAG: FkbM family methyltransferase [Synechococcus sp. WH 8007]|nr:FkbM family methyltransferase [Synechococcus sp. WH 8007]